MAFIDYDLADGVARIIMNSPPVNALGRSLRKELAAALDSAHADSDVKAIVLAGNSTGFSGGADIGEFQSLTAFAEPSVPTIIKMIESSSKPVVAAVSGVCLGGGLELALGCHYRVGKKGAKIGLPEVTLGILPGAGGTQRLPRLVGVELALNMIVGGRTYSAEELEHSGLFDKYVLDDVIKSAVGFASALCSAGASAPRVTSEIVVDYPNAEAFFQFARANVRASAKNFPAPNKCVDAVAASVSMKFREGLQFERAAFDDLVKSNESQALRHAFFAERSAAKIPDVPGSTPLRAIEQIGVVGAGTMGAGIAMCFLNAGIPVTIVEANKEALDRGVEHIRATYGAAVKRGRLTAADLERQMALLTPSLSMEDIKNSDLVIEAVFEDLQVKEAIFRELGKLMKRGAILATNTSTLDVNRLASVSGRAKDVVGMHFFSPANVMRLLEVVRGTGTAIDVLATVMSVAKKIKKIAVVSGVCDGFIGNRMLNEYLREAFSMIEEGASPVGVDRAIEQWGMAMGPFRMLDLAGNDVHWAVRKRQRAEHPDKLFSEVADEICELGRYGQKSGKGWYRYQSGERAALPDPEVDELIEKFRARNGIKARKISSEEIQERLVFALVDEGARILEEGVAARASDIDIVYLFGYGFPTFRGGPMFHANQTGLYNVVRSLERYRDSRKRKIPDWQPAPLLRRLVAEDKDLV